MQGDQRRQTGEEIQYAVRPLLAFALNLVAPTGLLVIWFALHFLHQLPGMLFHPAYQRLWGTFVVIGWFAMMVGLPGYLASGPEVRIRRRWVIKLAPLMPFALLALYLFVFGPLLSFLVVYVTLVLPLFVVPLYFAAAVDAYRLAAEQG